MAATNAVKKALPQIMNQWPDIHFEITDDQAPLSTRNTTGMRQSLLMAIGLTILIIFFEKMAKPVERWVDTIANGYVGLLQEVEAIIQQTHSVKMPGIRSFQVYEFGASPMSTSRTPIDIILYGPDSRMFVKLAHDSDNYPGDIFAGD